MKQNDIFQLLLIILLMSNHEGGRDEDCGPFGNFNCLIITVLLLGMDGFGLGRRQDCNCIRKERCPCEDRINDPFVQ